MVWVESATNGNVFEVPDEALAAKLEAEGHKIHQADPRSSRKPKSK